MKLISCLLLSSFLALSATAGVGSRPRPVLAPLHAITATPSDYSGIRVSTVGVVGRKNGKGIVCIDSGSASVGVYQNCVPFEHPDRQRPDLAEKRVSDLMGEYVLVIGTFDAGLPKPRLYVGVIRDVTTFEKFDSSNE